MDWRRASIAASSRGRLHCVQLERTSLRRVEADGSGGGSADIEGMVESGNGGQSAAFACEAVRVELRLARTHSSVRSSRLQVSQSAARVGRAPAEACCLLLLEVQSAFRALAAHLSSLLPHRSNHTSRAHRQGGPITWRARHGLLRRRRAGDPPTQDEVGRTR